MLADAARHSQLLVRPKMVSMFHTFDNILRQLSRLAARRRLFNEELYTATFLMSELTTKLHDEWEDAASGGGKSHAGRSHAGKSHAGKSHAASYRRSAVSNVDHTQGVYLRLIGRAVVQLGSTDVTITHLEGDPPLLPKPGQRVQIEGTICTVRSAMMGLGEASATLKLAQPFEPSREMGWTLHPNLQAGGSGEVWVMLEMRTPGVDKDLQTLLLNLKAHNTVLQLLKLPFTRKHTVPSELGLRALIRMCYRLLKAMTVEFSVMQGILADHLPLFVLHTEANLVSHDISPTDAIDAICKDNRPACMKVSADVVKHFVRLAAATHAPRYIRFLQVITTPMGSVIERNQELVASALAQKSEALVLYTGAEGRQELQKLADADDLHTHPRGELAYHVELIGLLSSVVTGGNKSAEALVHNMLPLEQLLEQLLYVLPSPSHTDGDENVGQAGGDAAAAVNDDDRAAPTATEEGSVVVGQLKLRVPRPLVQNLLKLLLEGYLVTERSSEQLTLSESVSKLVSRLAAIVAHFVHVTLAHALAQEEQGGQLEDEDLDAFIGEYALAIDITLVLLSTLYGKLQADLEQDQDMVAAYGLVSQAAEELALAQKRSTIAQQQVDFDFVRQCCVQFRTRRQLEDRDSEGIGNSNANAMSDEGGIADDRFAKGGGSEHGSGSGVDLSTSDVEHDYDHESPLPVQLSPSPSIFRTGSSSSGFAQSVQQPAGVVSLADLQEPVHIYRSGDKAADSQNAPVEHVPQECLGKFVDAYNLVTKPGEEFDGLVQVYMNSIEKESHHRRLHGNATPIPVELRHPELANLLAMLLQGTAKEEEHLDDTVLQQTLTLVRVLCRILDTAADDGSEEKLAEVQDLLGCEPPLGLRGCRVVVTLIACEDDQLCGAGLNFGIALLKGGNECVQQTICDLLHGFGSAGSITSLSAFDGSHGHFLEMLKLRLRKAHLENSESRLYLENQQAHLAHFDEETIDLSPATAAAMREELEQPFPSPSFVFTDGIELVEFLRLLTEGHNNEMQKLLAEQPWELNSIDLIYEVFELLLALESELHETNLKQVIKCIETLSEFVQGNLSMEIKHRLMESKLTEVLDRLLHKQTVEQLHPPKLDSVELSEQLGNLHLAIVTLLMSLLEGSDPAVERVLSRILDIDQIAVTARELYCQAFYVAKESSQKARHPQGNSSSFGRSAERMLSSREEKLVDLGSAMYRLVKHVKDYEEQTTGRSGSAGAVVSQSEHSAWHSQSKSERTMADVEADEFYASITGSVEIINHVEQLERVYFRFPAFCNALGEERKQALLWSVDRETPSRQLFDFLETSQGIHVELKHFESISMSKSWRILRRHRALAGESMFLLALMINSFVMWRAEMCLKNDDDVGVSVRWVWSDRYCSSDAERVLTNGTTEHQTLVHAESWLRRHDNSTFGAFGTDWGFDGDSTPSERMLALMLELSVGLLGALMLVHVVLLLLQHGMETALLRMRTRWCEYTGLTTYEQVLTRVSAEPLFHLMYYTLSPVFFFLNGKLVYLVASTVAAFLAFSHTPYFFALHLFDIVFKSQDLQNVWKAVSQNGWSIVMTAAFMLIIVYAYALFGYNYLAQDFIIDAPFKMKGLHLDDNAQVCSSLLFCFIGIANHGLREGIGGVLDNPMNPDLLPVGTSSFDDTFWLQTIYAWSFWFIVSTVLLSVISGIIIDSFGSLRGTKLAIKHNMENTCFICSVDRFTLDTKGDGFEKHIKAHHNMWMYLYMIIMLKEKHKTDYNGWESHVARKLESKDLTFFPRNTAIVLKEVQEREASESRAQAERMLRVEEKVNDLDAKLDTISNSLLERQHEIEQKVLAAAREGAESLRLSVERLLQRATPPAQ